MPEAGQPEPAAAPAPVENDAEDAGEGEGPKLLSKKEKERLKKEKDKVSHISHCVVIRLSMHPRPGEEEGPGGCKESPTCRNGGGSGNNSSTAHTRTPCSCG